MAKWRMSDAEFKRQYAQATRRGEQKMKTEPRAKSARYDRKSGKIIVELTNGCTFVFPPELAQGLAGAKPEELAGVEILPPGFALGWDKLDAHFSLAGLLQGIFGTRAWMSELGRRGGSVTSEAKAAAVRENGKKGGRPRKVAHGR